MPEYTEIGRDYAKNKIVIESWWLTCTITNIRRLRNRQGVIWQNRIRSISEMPRRLTEWEVI